MDDDGPLDGREERPGVEPPEERVAVRSVEVGVELVSAGRSRDSGRPPEEVEVVVAEGGLDPVPGVGGPPEDLARTGAAVHEVADEDDPAPRTRASRSRRGASEA